MEQPARATLVSKQRSPAARTRALGLPRSPHHQTGDADTEPGTPPHRPPAAPNVNAPRSPLTPDSTDDISAPGVYGDLVRLDRGASTQALAKWTSVVRSMSSSRPRSNWPTRFARCSPQRCGASRQALHPRRSPLVRAWSYPFQLDRSTLPSCTPPKSTHRGRHGRGKFVLNVPARTFGAVAARRPNRQPMTGISQASGMPDETR